MAPRLVSEVPPRRTPGTRRPLRTGKVSGVDDPRTSLPQQPEWTDWKWQMRQRIRTGEDLARWVRLTEAERGAIESTRGLFQLSLTPYYAALIDPGDPDCPIRRQVVPRPEEVEPDPAGVEDPLAEVAHSPVKNLIHNYPDRVAFCVTSECAIYCRFCLRKRMVGEPDFAMSRTELQAALEYIASRPQIRDVLLTGGDPLVLGDEALGWILERLRAIPHVQIIRLGTRMPAKLPFRINEELCRLLERYHPVWVNAHFNHPREVTPVAAAAVDRLLRAGVPVGNQSVLLRGINDDVETLKALGEELVRIRVRPYYLYQAQLVAGTAHLRTSIEKGLELMEALQGRTTGFAIPRYVLDTPLGKVPLQTTALLGRAGDRVVMRTWSGQLWAEPNPIPPGEHPGYRLPKIDLPEPNPAVPVEGIAE